MAKPFPLRRFQNDSYPPRRFGGGVGSSPGSRFSPAVQYRWRENAERARSAGARVPFHIDRNSAVTDNRPMGAGPRILVVDDNDDNCYTLKLHLDLEGYTDVATARDGEEAIALLETSAFDLVLLDVMMPKVDGFQVLAWLKDQARLRDLPVIMISALTEMNSMARCIELGAVHGTHQEPDPYRHRAHALAAGNIGAAGRDHRPGQSRALPEQRRHDVRDAVLRDARTGKRRARILQCRPQRALSPQRARARGDRGRQRHHPRRASRCGLH